MQQQQIKTVLSQLATTFDMTYAPSIHNLEEISYDIGDFIQTLQSEAEKMGLLIIEKNVTKEHLEYSIKNNDFPIIYFTQVESDIVPVIDGRTFKPQQDFTYLVQVNGLVKEKNPEPLLFGDTVKILTAFPVQSVSEESREEEQNEVLRPFQRLVRMLKVERKDIIAIYIYALLIGAISLVLPLGIQAIIGLVQGGLVFSSIYILIGLVFFALIVSGVMQVMQLSLVEYLVERLFSKAAFDYAFRIPRIKAEALLKYYPPELMNRFFDITTVQKTLPKLLIDITAALIQIIFGLLLLTAYHPLFIIFGLLTIILVLGVTRIYGSRTLDSNIVKSKYKYKIAQWLQDLARTSYTFKVAGNTTLPLQRMEMLLNGYLKYRKKYFDYLLVLFYNAVFFKALVTGGLLIVGTYLVINRQITIGQFVASEIVVVLVVGSVEKILLSLDSVFDLLTALDKLGQVSDLPLESTNGKVKHFNFSDKAIEVKVQKLTYVFEDNYSPTLKDCDLHIKSGESVCITGSNGSGKETLLNVLAGILTSYNGNINFNGVSLRDIEQGHLHEVIERNVSADGIFDGTLLENITMSRRKVQIKDVYWVMKNLNMEEAIGRLKEGLSTQMISGGRRFSQSFSTKVTLARCIVNKPKLLMLSNCYEHIDKQDLRSILKFLIDKSQPWTFITVSNDPQVMKACDRLVVLDEGRVSLDGTYESLINEEGLKRCID
ncbi:ABC-type bacteriocin/lantibiotic exporter, contains an N-terminal double-glycine peptidase domain [Spirosomataceae bacterium TFI 002]|nr:ABC-type bacteriocin/lantibiotic exporter, contains an N-terminal double-glycine peptidase domain [Spirosomataceae bacterium TFI 002]